MRLHLPVIFIGDRPSQKNLSMDTPFVGTSSYRTLLDWIYRMNVDINQVDTIDAYTVSGQNALIDAHFKVIYQAHKVVLLGREARVAFEVAVSNMLTKPQYFCLPHPAEETDKKKLSSLLVRCRDFIYK